MLCHLHTWPDNWLNLCIHSVYMGRMSLADVALVSPVIVITAITLPFSGLHVAWLYWSLCIWPDVWAFTLLTSVFFKSLLDDLFFFFLIFTDLAVKPQWYPVLKRLFILSFSLCVSFAQSFTHSIWRQMTTVVRRCFMCFLQIFFPFLLKCMRSREKAIFQNEPYLRLVYIGSYLL